MLFSKFLGLFRERSVPSVPAAPAVVTSATPDDPIHYPPADPGLPLISPVEILAANSDLIDRLKLHAALPLDLFQSRFLDPIERLAETVNCLPATSTDHFSGQGGLFRAAFEMAFQSFQASDGRIFTGKESVERRHALEGRWRYTSFLVGLLYPIGTPLDIVTVTDASGATWRKQLSGLTKWANQVGATHIYVGWPQSSSQDTKSVGPSPSTTAHVQNIVGVENLQWLEDGSPEFVKLIYGVASGQKISGNPITGLLEEVWSRILQRESARRPLNYGRVVSGTHVGPYLVGALRDIVSTGRWKINDECLKVDQTGVYLVWPDAGAHIIEYGREKGYAGWPSDAATIEALLKSTGIVLNELGAMGYREVVDEIGEIRQALQLTNPLSLIENYDPSDYSKAGPKNLESLQKADPLPAVVSKKTTRKKSAPEPESAIVQPSLIDDGEAAPDAEAEEQTSGDQSAPLESVKEVPDEANNRAPQVQTAVAKPEAAAGDLPKKEIEPPDVRFADLLPSDVKKQFRNPLIAEFLGKIIKTARTESLAKAHMRMTENGLAIQLKFLKDNIRDLNVWVDAMSNAGFIYTDPGTLGKKVYDVAIPLGSKPVNAIILSRLAVKKLDL